MKFHKFIYLTDFLFENNKLVLTQEGWKKIKKIKKITGSRFSSVLGLNNFVSPFQVWCEMFGFFQLKQENFFMNAGTIIEPKIKSFVIEKTKKYFISYSPQKHGFDLFPENKIFGGIPDGEEYNFKTKSKVKDGTILEIKTIALNEYYWTKRENEFFLVRDNLQIPKIKMDAIKITKWFKQQKIILPINYQYQLGLYLFLRQQTKGLFALAFLNHEDYLTPEHFNPQKNLIILEEMNVDLDFFGKKIELAEQWYKNHILTGISPELTSNDLEWIRFGYKDLK